MDDNRRPVTYYVDGPSYSPKKPKKRGGFSYFLVALIAALIGGIIAAYIVPNYLYGKIMPVPDIYKKGQEEYNQNVTITPKDNDATTVTAVAKKAMKSTVGITTVEVVRDIFFMEREVEGVGSGVIVDSNGYILTNSHVIGDGEARRITVLFENGDKKPGKVLWFDPALDLAVVKVDATGLPAAELGNSNDLQVGQLAVAIGNPLGLDFQRTVTSGIISGLHRSIKVDKYNIIEDLIQTDASINPGNSGGPLLNSEGKVIGINTAKIQTAESLGFSIPINVVKPIVKEVLKQGSFKTVFIGIQGIEVGRYENTTGMDLNIKEGIVILDVVQGSPAEKAGLLKYDILTHIDGEEIENNNQLKRRLYKYKPGDKATLTIVRDGERKNIEIEFSVEK